jgi:hypothetical protein
VKHSDTLQRASGRWPEILVAIGGITPDQLCRREGPCPACQAMFGDAGNTRFKWDDDSGDGAWHCSHCGGKGGKKGGGNGVDLLSRLRGLGWGPSALAPTLKLVEEEFFGRSGRRRAGSRRSAGPQPPAGTPPRPRPPSDWVAFCWLEAADQLADGEGFNPAHARGGAYVRRWLRWCEGADPDLVAAAVLEGDTQAGGREIPDLEEPPPAAKQTAGPAGPMSREEVRRRLAAAVEEGAPRLDLEGLLLELGELAEISPSNLRGLLQAVQREHEAARSVEAEEQRLVVAADRQDVGRALVTLDGLLPPSLADAIRLTTQYLPADDATRAGVFLAAASGVLRLGTELVASRICNFKAPLNLYCALVGKVSVKKGPVWKALAKHPLEPIVTELNRRHETAMAAWRQECQGKKPHERDDPPRAVRLSIDEYTGESLASQFQVQEQAGAGIILLRDEIAGLFGTLNKYTGRGDDQQRLLEMYEGGGFSSLRVGVDGGGRFFSKCHFSILGTIQPEVLQSLVAGGDPGGLWARFLFLPMPPRVIELPATESEEDVRAVQLAAETLAATMRALHRLPPMSLAMDPEARRMFTKYEVRCQRDALASPIAAQSGAWGKAPGKALRIAGILHLLHRVSPDGDVGDLVSSRTLQAACNLVDHLTGWALGIHEAAAGGEASDLMGQIHRIAQAAGQAIAWRDVSRRLSLRQRAEIDSAAAHVAVAALARLGVGEVGEGRRPGSWTYRATADLPG